MDMHAQEQEEWARILALEHEIREEWARIQELESREIQDEGEEFFNSLDPESWEDKNETPFLFRLTKQLRKWNRENFEESTDSIGGEDASSKRLKGVAARWNPRGFGFIIPEDGGDDIFCILSSITDGNALREGDIVEYEAEYDDRRGKYQAIKVTLTARNARKKRKKRNKLPASAPATGGGYPTSTYGAPAAGYGYAAPASYGCPTYSPPQGSNWCIEKIEVKVVSGEYIDRTGTSVWGLQLLVYEALTY
jgi:cold shock CspA family protein